MVPIVMCHENDPERGGCEFGRFFGTTPQDLIDDGLYRALAFAAYPGMEHRAASLALLAKALGAKPQKLSGAAWARSSQAMAMVELSKSAVLGQAPPASAAMQFSYKHWHITAISSQYHPVQRRLMLLPSDRLE